MDFVHRLMDWDFCQEIDFGRFSSDRAPKTNAKKITNWYSTARARRRHTKTKTYPMRLSTPAYTIILPTHWTITPHRPYAEATCPRGVLLFFYGDDVSDENYNSELDTIVHTVAIRRGIVLLATCQSQAVIIKAFTASPAFDT